MARCNFFSKEAPCGVISMKAFELEAVAKSKWPLNEAMIMATNFPSFSNERFCEWFFPGGWCQIFGGWDEKWPRKLFVSRKTQSEEYTSVFLFESSWYFIYISEKNPAGVYSMILKISLYISYLRWCFFSPLSWSGGRSLLTHDVSTRENGWNPSSFMALAQEDKLQVLGWPV